MKIEDAIKELTNLRDKISGDDTMKMIVNDEKVCDALNFAIGMIAFLNGGSKDK